jgi:hypothetical protein
MAVFHVKQEANIFPEEAYKPLVFIVRTARQAGRSFAYGQS